MITLSRLIRTGIAAATLASLSVIAGCWDEVNLQDVSYVSALGIDYVDEKIVIYGQIINFASVAKSDAPNSKPAETWVGTGTGNSTLLAYYDLMRAGYATLNLEHLKTVLIHERAAGQIEDVLDALNRQRASRYTSLIFGTTDDIENVLNSDNFFNQSPLYSVLYMPKPHEEQYTFIEPLQMQLAVQTIREPKDLTLLPVINSSGTHWSKRGKPISTQLISGVFVYKDFKYMGYFSEKSVIGLRWLNPEFKQVLVEAEQGGATSTVSIKHAKSSLEVSKAGGGPRFTISLKLSGSVVELDGEMTKEGIESSVEELVRGQIQSLFDTGRERGVDFLELEHYLYRYHNRYWHEHIEKEDWNKGTLAEIKVDFGLTDSGKFVLRKGA
ncbi:Ger(x)C family spore germination protein [Paenibacillus sp. PAMC21692]|uniref:Ger(x)C family spore germination protein n=1 Tax=Paenibacillus sp. PAMC21692 TaxID=2762320 RepID=UPI00164DA5CB|nr:Ger(x)C family spore germination protein [Paenibacillus sp. PAMC21692]QNK59845.1 Ger(x)C family spore germination protein [Paenibacillus sp. PAMC21692]